MAAGSSERGLSLVATTKSDALAGCLTHFRALGAVTVAAAAKEVMTRGPDVSAVIWRASASKVAERIVCMRVVDDDREGLTGVDGLKSARDGRERGNSCDESRRTERRAHGRR